MRTVSLQNVTNAEKLPSNNATISKPSEIWVVVEGEYEGGYPDTSKFTKDNMYLMDLNMRIEKKKTKNKTHTFHAWICQGPLCLKLQ